MQIQPLTSILPSDPRSNSSASKNNPNLPKYDRNKITPSTSCAHQGRILQPKRIKSASNIQSKNSRAPYSPLFTTTLCRTPPHPPVKPNNITTARSIDISPPGNKNKSKKGKKEREIRKNKTKMQRVIFFFVFPFGYE